MAMSMRCPHCGRSGATRTESVREYSAPPAPAVPGQRGRLVSQTDRYECEHCGLSWDEVAYGRATAGALRAPV
jgi:predicted RNA-binding Zn-ribbon protein involved in translation (DUF1610 family)